MKAMNPLWCGCLVTSRIQVVFFFSKTQEKKNFFTKIKNKCVL